MGVKFVNKLCDFINQEGPKFCLNLLKCAQIKLIKATPVVLRPFDETLQKATVEALTQRPKSSN